MSEKTFDAWVAQVLYSHRANTQGQRIGQMFYNELVKIRPELASEVNSTDADPFYQDIKLGAFLEWVEDRWDSPQSVTPGPNSED